VTFKGGFICTDATFSVLAYLYTLLKEVGISSMHRWGTLVLGCDISDDGQTAKEPQHDKTCGICYN
jgi:hypothetical protein